MLGDLLTLLIFFNKRILMILHALIHAYVFMLDSFDTLLSVLKTISSSNHLFFSFQTPASSFTTVTNMDFLIILVDNSPTGLTISTEQLIMLGDLLTCLANRNNSSSLKPCSHDMIK